MMNFLVNIIPDHKDRLKYITGFSGSYGFALILNSKNYLFVDGRYTLQAINKVENFLKLKQYLTSFLKKY
jgi:hypothetical protein